MKRLCFILLLLCSAGWPAIGESSSTSSLDVELTLHENASLDVQETMILNTDKADPEVYIYRNFTSIFNTLGDDRWDRGITVHSVLIDGRTTQWTANNIIDEHNGRLELRITPKYQHWAAGRHVVEISYSFDLGILPENQRVNYLQWVVRAKTWPTDPVGHVSIVAHLPASMSRQKIAPSATLKSAAIIPTSFDPDPRDVQWQWTDDHTWQASADFLDFDLFAINLRFPASMFSNETLFEEKSLKASWISRNWTTVLFWIVFGFIAVLISKEKKTQE